MRACRRPRPRLPDPARRLVRPGSAAWGSAPAPGQSRSAGAARRTGGPPARRPWCLGPAAWRCRIPRHRRAAGPVPRPSRTQVGIPQGHVVEHAIVEQHRLLRHVANHASPLPVVDLLVRNSVQRDGPVVGAAATRQPGPQSWTCRPQTVHRAPSCRAPESPSSHRSDTAISVISEIEIAQPNGVRQTLGSLPAAGTTSSAERAWSTIRIQRPESCLETGHFLVQHLHVTDPRNDSIEQQGQEQDLRHRQRQRSQRQRRD